MITTNVEALRRLFGFKGGPDLQPRFNLAPSQSAPIVRLSPAGEREVVMLRWGLIPSWAKDPSIGNRVINARAETLTEKASFRAALRDRRCLVLADGFYEWQRRGTKKQPYFVKTADGLRFAMAGLWERWNDRASGESVESFTIVTTAASEALQAVHERMPAILYTAGQEAWLTARSAEAIEPLLRPFSGPMTTIPVTTFVNSPKNDSPSSIEPAS